jgi:hypothetical protein
MIHAKRTAVCLGVVLLVVAMVAAGCGQRTSSATTGSSSSSSGGKAVDYAKLLTLDDAKSISGYADSTVADSAARLGSSKYLVIYDSPKVREFLWLRVGGSSMYDEQRKVAAGAEKSTKVRGVEAFTWNGENIDSGVAMRKDGTTYLITSDWNSVNGKIGPGLSDEQLMQAANLVAERLP